MTLENLFNEDGIEDIFNPEKAFFKELEEVLLINMFVCPKCSRQVEIEEGRTIQNGDLAYCDRCETTYRIRK